jgi:hypothetical protein
MRLSVSSRGNVPALKADHERMGSNPELWRLDVIPYVAKEGRSAARQVTKMSMSHNRTSTDTVDSERSGRKDEMYTLKHFMVYKEFWDQMSGPEAKLEFDELWAESGEVDSDDEEVVPIKGRRYSKKEHGEDRISGVVHTTDVTDNYKADQTLPANDSRTMARSSGSRADGLQGLDDGIEDDSDDMRSHGGMSATTLGVPTSPRHQESAAASSSTRPSKRRSASRTSRAGSVRRGAAAAVAGDGVSVTPPAKKTRQARRAAAAEANDETAFLQKKEDLAKELAEKAKPIMNASGIGPRIVAMVAKLVGQSDVPDTTEVLAKLQHLKIEVEKLTQEVEQLVVGDESTVHFKVTRLSEEIAEVVKNAEKKHATLLFLQGKSGSKSRATYLANRHQKEKAWRELDAREKLV